MRKPRNRVNYRKIWEGTHKACLLPGMHIHHLDNNPLNNAPSNLIACTPEEHWQIHYAQGDSIALRGKWIQYANRDWSKEDKIKIAKAQGSKPFLVYKSITIQKNNNKWGIKSIYKKGEFVGKFESISECERALGVKRAAIRGCLQRHYHSRGGFVFEYEVP